MVALPPAIAGKERFRTVASMVVADEIVVETDIRLVTTTEVADVADTLEEAVKRAAARVGGFPEAVFVRRLEVAEALEPRLGKHGCEVVADSTLPGLDPIVRAMTADLAGETGWPVVRPPPTWAAWGLPGALVRDLFSAYARFHEAAPWRWFDDTPPIVAEWSDGEDPWLVSVLGAALGEYGLAVHSDPFDFDATMSWDEDEPPFPELEGWIVHLGYQRRRDLGRAMLREVSGARWEVVGPAAYPYILPILTPGGGLQEDLVRRLAELLRGVAALGEEWAEKLRSPDGVAVTETRGRMTLRYVLPPEGAGPPIRLPPELEEVLVGWGEGDFPSLADAQVELDRRMEVYHATPQEGLAGISPDQARTLLLEDLEGTGVLRFSRDLTLEELQRGAFPFNARIFLTWLEEGGAAPATAAGNLKRVFVAEMLERMRLPEGFLDHLHRRNKVVNEADAWPIHVVRVNLELGGLIRRREGRFLITRQGRDLVSPDAAGDLYRHLFKVHFGEFDLEYGRGVPSGPDLQMVVPLLLWQIGVWARDWITVESLSARLLPESLQGPDDSGKTAFRSDSADVYAIILRPLMRFGLLEERDVDMGGEEEDEDEWWRWRPDANEVRTTPLFGRFISFEWE